MIELICADCLEVLPRLGNVQMVFADPPFNVRKRYGAGRDNRDDYAEWTKGWARALWATLLDTGTFCLMTIPRHLPLSFDCLKTGVFVNQIIWRNVAAAQGNKTWWGSYQPILVYGKTADYKFNLYAETRKIEKQNLRWGGYTTEPKGRLLDYWDDIPFVYAGSVRHPEAILAPGTNTKAHPCQMPTTLALRLIEFLTDPGDTVLDPFCGTGTTLVACKMSGRNGIGVDIEPKYVEIARRRIDATTGPIPFKDKA